MQVINTINLIVTVVVFLCCAHQYFYLFVPFFKKHKPHKETKNHNYAVLISARNEENVIAELIRSIKQQNYPSELITVFVVADNCTDSTAETARKAGAVVWERFNRDQVGKGYALDFLLQHIKEAYPDDPFDGYFVFDADNLLDENYVREMNKTFSDGHPIITSYRNSKNYGDNWISAGYGLMFLREAKYINNSRMLLGTSCAISGTGFLFSREIKNKIRGWHFHLLTEDIQFTAHNVMKGRKIAYCPTAILYDEQPLTFGQSWTQRLRWAKGYLQVFTHYSRNLFKGIFKLHSFSCYDFFLTLVPISLVTLSTLIMNSIAVIVGLSIGADVGQTAMSIAMFFINLYLVFFAMGALTVITEWNQIHCRKRKKIGYIFTFPIFMMTYIPIAVAAVCRKVEWKPIRHGGTVVKNLSDVYTQDDTAQFEKLSKLRAEERSRDLASAGKTVPEKAMPKQKEPVPQKEVVSKAPPMRRAVSVAAFERLPIHQTAVVRYEYQNLHSDLADEIRIYD